MSAEQRAARGREAPATKDATEETADKIIADAAQRAEALDAGRSIIVQAPAGSGKTELLIQRYLKLLGLVDAPEEVLAITFTRKAAGEMRLRVLVALEQGEGPEPPEQPHQRTTWGLARVVVARDKSMSWNIAESPARLRIQTIDALCAALTRQMPWLSRFGGQPTAMEHAGHLYDKAARATLAHIDAGSGKDGAENAQAVVRLLRHLDNNLARATALLTTMLARRDQWLRHLRGGDPAALRAQLERVLAGIVRTGIGQAAALITGNMARELPELAAYAAKNLAGEKPDDPIVACGEMEGMPGAADLPQWKGLAALLLTKEGSIRGRLSKAEGFPAPPTAKTEGEKSMAAHMKGRMEGLLAMVSESGGLPAAINALRALPPARFPDAQWDVLEALLTLLPLAVKELRKVFAQTGEVDFPGVSLGAVAALAQSTDGQPPRLDYRIRHLLVDEFQDTSFSQIQLLEHLTAGWEPGDGRTLFLVGDPMQSIYRFREADVSLYLRVRSHGIGKVQLTPLSLSVNFRSQQGIVDWLNTAFPRIFPEAEEELSGAVAYSPSSAIHPAGAHPAVQIHPWLTRDDAAEAERVVELVRQARAERPEGGVAILVRSRSHLSAILPALGAAGLAYQAIDIDPLAERPTVQDLLALTRALHHPADRVAWLALLRAPWCGLELADLLVLAGDEARETIWQRIRAPEAEKLLSVNGRRRLARVREAIEPALKDYRHRGMRPRVEGCWLALGGAAGLEESELAEARAFLALLDGLEQDSEAFDLAELERRVGRMFAPPDPAAPAQLQIMSIHKAKGLEFDTVILPGMGRRPRSSETGLLLWSELAGTDAGGGGMLLTPISEAGEARDEIYNYVAELHKERDRLELARLLYVALTRAAQQVHLLGHSAGNNDGVQTPPRGTLLNHLWPVAGPDFEPELKEAAQPPPPQAQPDVDAGGPQGERSGGRLRRLAHDWRLPPPPARVDSGQGRAAGEEEQETREFVWARDSARHIGTVVHHMLQRIAKQQAVGWDTVRIETLGPMFRAELVRLGVAEAELDQGAEKVAMALKQTLADETGRWLLGPHAQAEAELALTAMLDGRPVHVVIDRTFVDEVGLRWIVDYKTGSREGGDREGYLDNEQNEYRGQLERYARILRKYDPVHPIRLGLYFPLMRAFREWEPEPEPPSGAVAPSGTGPG